MVINVHSLPSGQCLSHHSWLSPVITNACGLSNDNRRCFSPKNNNQTKSFGEGDLQRERIPSEQCVINSSRLHPFLVMCFSHPQRRKSAPWIDIEWHRYQLSGKHSQEATCHCQLVHGSRWSNGPSKPGSIVRQNGASSNWYDMSSFSKVMYKQLYKT